MCISMNTGSATEQCCSCLEMVPPFVALGSCITALAISIIAHKRNYIIVHGSGTAASLYLLSLSSRFATSKSIAASAEDLKKANVRLNGEVNRLEGSVAEFEKNNTELKATLTNFQDERAHLHDERVRISESIKELRAALCIREQQDEARRNNLHSDLVGLLKTVREEGQDANIRQNQAIALALRQEIEKLEGQLDVLQRTSKRFEDVLKKMDNHDLLKPKTSSNIQ